MEKHYDFKKIEKEMQKLWEENNIYKFNEKNENEIFSIDTPPPTVSGDLHIGHVFSYTQGEIISRFKRMQGYNVFYPFGFDDNGLPTEKLVEKVEKISASKTPRSEFTEKCMKVSEEYEIEFKDLWKSLGFSADWSLEYKTISPFVQKMSQKSFLELVKLNKAYIKESPILWCTKCHTSIAQADLEAKELETTFNYITFMVSGDPLTIATTRPELLYGCVCLFINPNDERYKSYIGKTAIVPLYNYEIPILADEKVNQEKGTGVVMCATFGDSTDVEWFLTYDLPFRKVISPDGKIYEDVPFIGSLGVDDGREKIINLLIENNLLVKSENIVHSVGVHERCNHETEIIPSKQWYIDILSDRELFLKAADEINWYPANMKNKLIDWINNLKWDWCISRQRYFGVPFPVWYCKNCSKPFFAKYEDLPINPIETKLNETCSCGCTEFIPETAVFDTWMTSSITPLINAKYGEDGDISDKILPMTMRTQAHEIIRTWAFYTIVKSLYHTNKLPWKDIMICGFVLAKKGEKISKSKNNSSSTPSALIENHSADALRYWAANARLGTDTSFSVNDLSICKRFITKLWNASKFAILHLEDFDPDFKVDLLPVDRWIIEKTKEVTIKAQNYLDKYEIGLARHEIDKLFWKDFCDYYIEIVKDRLYKPEIHGHNERISGQFGVYFSLLNILKLYAIYVPHITEHIYQEFFRKFEKELSIHQLTWNKSQDKDENILEFGEKLKDIISSVRKYKSQHNLSMKDEIEKLNIISWEKYMELFKLTEKDIKACCNTPEILYVSL